MIQITGLSFKFAGTSTLALGDVNLTIRDGEFVIITGPSGSGKSTLCLCMCGFIPQGYNGDFKGKVMINNKDTKEHGVFELSREIGIVQQDPESQLCTLNVIDEVAFGPENFLLPEEEIAKRIDWALKVVGATHLKDRETSTLSGGEKQRLAIASILALKPDIVIFDEPTSQLDPKATAQIFSIITNLQHQTNMTIIVVEHKLYQILPFSSRVIVIDKGNIIIDAPSGELITYHDRLKEMGVRLPFQRRKEKTSALNVHDSAETMLEVKNLSVKYPRGNAVLKNVTFNVKKGEIVGLMGDNGSGKTTLLLSILGLKKPFSGRIMLNGRDAAKMSFTEHARQIGFIFQNPNHQIFEINVLKETTFAPTNFGENEKQSEEKALKLLSAFNLTPYKDRHPFGLSYGEKRRLNLASIFIYEPNLLLMDEPFVGQDFKNIQQLMMWTNGFVGQGKSAIMVIHDPEIAEMYCNRLVFLKEGKTLVDEPTERAFLKLAELGEEEYTPQIWSGKHDLLHDSQ